MEQPQIDPHTDTEQRSLKEIFADLVRDIENIFRNEFRLATIELKTKFKEAAFAGGLLAGAGLFGFFAMACFVAASIVALHIVLPLWLCCLILGVLLAVGAGGLFLVGRMLLQEIDPVPQRTVQTLKEDLDWAKNKVAH